ncbi:Hydrogenase maturation GTPase HydF [uncultured Eubacteriales bacterium]|uniref:Hydrogenase maturation GTPase HydF n=1 Tax=uncultured Eubacteriales bacterium TaxID=172733 RepID=A0A212JD10_9FIRM|nr:Hydrogenase maturation GTPase HydF [uncultured Eubacteriales bacterium]
MGLNDTPSANRVHIGIFGRRNAGKSSVINAITGQDFAIVSDVKGTTTDPVYKAMELLPMGPVMLIDTPGIDDEGELGALRVKKARQVLNKTDVAVVVLDAASGQTKEDMGLIRLIEEKNIPYVLVYNKSDLLREEKPARENEIYISAKEKVHIEALKEKIASLAAAEGPEHRIVGDLIAPSDFVVLVTPIDTAAPKGRLILPQQQTIRDVLDSGAVAIVVKETELRETLESLGRKPSLVITDSQVFEKVSAIVPKEIPLTSFSILFARYKGLLDAAVKGAAALDKLKDGDNVLICEGCTHHRQCDDIGTVKLPRWIKNYTGKQLEFSFVSGTEFPDDVKKYQLIIHCGGCMLNEREVKYRQKCAVDQQVPITNYGIAIAAMQGILRRSVAMFPHLMAES